MKKLLFIPVIIVLYMLNIQSHFSDVPSKEEKEFYQALYKLVSQGKLDTVKTILENQEIDFSRYDNDNKYFTPIVYGAVWSKNKELVQYLIRKGANPSAKTSGNETPLHRAAWNGDLEMVQLLVEHGADVNIIYNANGGLSPLCCAAESGNIKIVKYLIDKGADVNYTNESSGSSPLRSAAYSANYDIFLLFAEKQPKTYDWQNALFYGLIGGNLDIVKYIVEVKGADVNKKSSTWGYPIERAAQNRYIRNEKNADPIGVIKYLVKKGARLTDINNGNVFEWAMENSTEETMEYLIAQGIKVDMKLTNDGWTTLASALDNGNFALAKHLLKQTKDHTFRGEPLIVFFADGLYNSPAIISLLIKEGVNKEYYTDAFRSSVARSDSVSAHLLLNAGADIHTLNPDGSNILHLARNYSIATFLIEKGADVHNKVMLENAWKNPSLLQALENVNVLPDISQANMNMMLENAAQAGDAWTLEYMLKRGADVNAYQLPKPDEQANAKDEEYRKRLRKTIQDEDELEKQLSSFEDNKPAYKQTPLIKNAIFGYSECDYSSYDEKNKKIQVSPRIAEILLNAGANPDMADTRGRTALHYVAGNQFCRIGIWPIPMGSRRDREQGAHGDPAMPPPQYHDLIAKVLISKGANLNIRDNNGDTPLIIAAKNRNDGVLKMLLDAGADVNIKNNREKDMFHYLDDPASFQVIKKAELWNRIPHERFNLAFNKFFTEYRPRGEYDAKELKTLLDYGANPNTEIYSSMDALAFTFDRIYGDNKYEIAQILIDKGFDMNAEDKWGFTILTNIIKKNQYKDSYSNDKNTVNLDFLIKNGIDINHKSSTQFTALTVAKCEGKEDAVEVLLRHGAKRDRQSEWWYLLRERYSDNNTLPALQQLIKEGIDINLQTPSAISEYVPQLKQKGVTALMFYAAYKRPDDVKALLKMGAKVNIKAADGSTALTIAKGGWKNEEVVEILIQAGAKE